MLVIHQTHGWLFGTEWSKMPGSCIFSLSWLHVRQSLATWERLLRKWNEHPPVLQPQDPMYRQDNA